MSFSVEHLCKHPFVQLTPDEKVQVVLAGRPQPAAHFWITFLPNVDPAKRCPASSLFKEVKWLTLCYQRKNFFCWPCLLFMRKTMRIDQSGIRELSDLRNIFQLHENDPEHLAAVLNLSMFAMKYDRKPNFVSDPVEYNYNIMKNLEILKLLIDAVCFAVKKKKKNSDRFVCNKLELGDCVKFLELKKCSDRSKIDVIDDAMNFLKQTVVDELVDAMTMILKIAVVRDTRASTFVSIILSEHVILDGKSQISTVLRYIKNGRVHERFVGFMNSVGVWKNYWKPREVLETHIANIVRAYEMREKFLALSACGAVLPRHQIMRLLSKVKGACNFKYYSPCHFHGYGRVLLQCISDMSECTVFFQLVDGIETFFENEQISKAFEKFLCEKVNVEDLKGVTARHLKGETWRSTSPFIVLLCIYWKYFILFFESILATPHNASAEEVVQTRVFKNGLLDLKTVFLLEVFYKLFLDYFDPNFNLHVDKPGVILGNPKTKDFLSNVSGLARSGFARIWSDAVLKKVGEDAPATQKLQVLNDPLRQKMARLYIAIMKGVMDELKYRALYYQKLTYCDVFNIQKTYSINFQGFDLGCDMHKELLQLNIDVKVAARDFKMLFKEPSLKIKSLYGLLQVIDEFELKDVFPSLNKMAELVLTLPYLPPTSRNDVKETKLQTISAFSYFPNSCGVPSGETSVLCIERLLLQELKNSESFYDDVIAKFYEQNKSMDIKQV